MGPLQRLDSILLSKESSKEMNRPSLKIARIEVFSPSLVKGFIPTCIKPM